MREETKKEIKGAVCAGLIAGVLFGLVEVICKAAVLVMTIRQYTPGALDGSGLARNIFDVFQGTLATSALYGLVGVVIGVMAGALGAWWSGFRNRPAEPAPLARYLARFSFPFLVLVGHLVLSRLLFGRTLWLPGGSWKGIALVCAELFIFYLLLRVEYAILAKAGRWDFSYRLKTQRGALTVGLTAAAILVAMSTMPNLLFQDRGDPGKPITAEEGTRPNIIFILLDTVRADRISCYGYERETTPFLDSFAAGATLFENAIAQAPWTLPSHASFFTGTYPSVNDAHGEHMFLDDSFVTLAELLSDRGYHTLCFSNNPYLSHFTGLSQGFDVLEEIWMKTFFLDDPILVSLVREVSSDRLPDNGARLTNRTIRRWFDRNYDEERPHFLFINYMDAHYPTRYLPGISDRFLSEGLDAVDLESFRIRNQLDFYPGGGGITDREFEILNVLYDGGIRYLDSKIAELFGFLETKGVLDGALVIIASDHGEEIGDHKEWGHQFALYDTLIRVPLILRLPGVFPEGLRVSGQAALIDIFPTVLDLLGDGWNSSNRQTINGRSLLDAIDGGQASRDVASELARPFLMVKGLSGKYPDVDFGFLMKRMRSIRRPSEKLIWSSDADHELYRINVDPGERENLYPQDAELTGELMKSLDRSGLSFRERDGSDSGFVMTPGRDAEEKLKALGYIR